MTDQQGERPTGFARGAPLPPVLLGVALIVVVGDSLLRAVLGQSLSPVRFAVVGVLTVAWAWYVYPALVQVYQRR